MKKMILAAHQPNYLPWAGYFYKMARCDVFVLLDQVQYSRTSYTARCLIKGVGGKARWLSVPVFKKGRYYQSISQVAIDNDTAWQASHNRTLQSCYSKAPYFTEHRGLLETAYDRPWQNLSELNAELTGQLAGLLGVKAKVVKQSELGVDSASSELLIELCRKMSAGVYLSGPGGRKYLDKKKFEEAGIELRFITYFPQAYPQLWGNFVPGLSIVDMLFNCGTQAAKKAIE